MQKIAILYDASQIVLSTFDLDEVLRRILATVRDYFRMRNGAIFLLDAKTQELYIKSAFGREEEKMRNLRIGLGSGITGTSAKLKRPIYVADVSKDPRYLENISSTKSELAIPLVVRDEVVGVLDFQSEELGGFDNETIDLLTLFSTQASIAIQNAELYSREQRRAAQLQAINGIAEETRALLDTEELLPKVCALVLKYFPVDHVSCLLLDNKKLILRAHQGSLSSTLPLGWEIAAGAGVSGKTLTEGRPIVVDDVTTFAGYVPGFREARAEMCLPLISFGQRIGVLALSNSEPDSFQSADLRALESVADIAAAAIQNAHSFERAKQMADVDGLTGVFNRRHLEKRIVGEIERLARYGHGMAILMVDIDHFKRINDEFGHMLGDEVLRQISQLMTQHLRKADIICRYGGEEFAILLPETVGESAVGVADKLRKKIEQFSFPGVARPVTISVGVADYPAHGQNRDELVRAADEALYSAKQAGRNRVMAWAARTAATTK
jgi:diguanylate cyclase (GGDEF)-like protein